MFKNVYLSLVTIALVLALVAGGTYAFFSDTKTETLTTSTASVKVGETTGFPLTFEKLVPGVETDWSEVSITNGSDIQVDLYTGLKATSGDADLRGLLTVWIERWNGTTWETKYENDVRYLFEAWQMVADDMPAGAKYYFRVKVKLDGSAGNEFQGKTIGNNVFIHAVQWTGGSPPTTLPANYP